MRMFNTAGPSVEGLHYMVDPLARLDLPEIEALIAGQRYFVLHAPRQTGKTTSLLALMAHLNARGTTRALYVNIEGAQAARGDVARGIEAVCSALARSAAYYLQDKDLEAWLRGAGAAIGPEDRFSSLLAHWAQSDPRPAVLMLDEVDALVGDTLISLLRQIRAGYAQRPQAFPQTIILCGVRDVRDYRIHTSHQEIITGGSAFNIKAESLRLGNLNRGETEALWRQHESGTGQKIDPAIWDELWEDTLGQPWLVNALGHELTWKDRELRDRSQPITPERYQAARERLIRSRATHLDQLTDKLREPRVNRVVAAFLSGDPVEERFPEDDLQYLEDLGLIRRKPQIALANRIYREILPREITAPIQDVLVPDRPWYVLPGGRLDTASLLESFQRFFREHSEAWLDGFEYKEAGPHLLLQAFLQRVVNGGGRINREYALGSRRTDLFLEWPMDEAKGFMGPVQRVVIELKLLRKAPEATLAEGLEQVADYGDRCGADEAHLVLFDRRPGVSWESRIWRKEVGNITVWGA